MIKSKQQSTTTTTPNSESKSRRNFLKLSATSGATIVAGSAIGLGTSATALATSSNSYRHYPSDRFNRAVDAGNLKVDAAEQHFYETIALKKQRRNGDESRYKSDNFYASFTKTLPSNDFGEVDPGSFRKLRKALRTGTQSDFDAIPLDPSANRKLANPQGALKFEISALDGHATRIKPSHKFRSAKLAGEQGEVYWQALTRDVPFIDYAGDALIDAAVNDLNNFSKTPGSKSDGNTNASLLFRGETPGDLSGPFVSQFLLRDFNFGPAIQVQRYEVPTAHVNFMVDQSNWLNIQRGGAPLESMSFDPVRRYIYNNRSLGEYVHRDVLFQAYLNACLQLLSYGADAIDQGNPYVNGDIDNQGGFTSLGGPTILDMVTRAGNLSLNGAWYQKWLHRFLRPEALGGRVHFNMTGDRSYELHPDILNSDAVAQTFSQNGTYFLPQAYAEGSPTHPSYPAGHATIAGACCTVLKAFFNESYVIDSPVQADASGSSLLAFVGDDLTVGNELNKLANNVAIARDAAGVHYRQDGIQGLSAGEQQAIALLQDHSRTFNEANFDGFTFTKFDGSTVNIKNGQVNDV